MNVLVTGVSSGIGRSLAALHLERGARVFGASRRTPEVLVDHERFRFVACDLADEEAVAPAVADLLAGETALDLVWLNAGRLGRIRDLADTPLDDLKLTMDVNVWANKLVLDALYSAGVSLAQCVAISSGAAVNGSRGWNGYSISKAALNMLVKLYATERTETHFCAFAPGLVDTAMQDYLCELAPDERFEALAKLRAARGTEAMPSPDEAAERLLDRLDDIRAATSGAFLDIRTM